MLYPSLDCQTVSKGDLPKALGNLQKEIAFGLGLVILVYCSSYTFHLEKFQLKTHLLLESCEIHFTHTQIFLLSISPQIQGVSKKTQDKESKTVLTLNLVLLCFE